MDFSTIRGSDGYFCSVSTGKALHQYTFKIKVLRNNPVFYKIGGRCLGDGWV